MKLSHSVWVARPLDAVWAFMSDIAATETLWQPDILSVVFDGEAVLAPSAIFVEERRSFGRTYVWTFEVTEVTPLRGYAIASISGKPAYRGRRDFLAVDGGTRIVEHGEILLPHFVEMFSPVLRPLAKNRLREAYRKLKSLLESQSA